MQSTRTRILPTQNEETYFDKPRIIHHTKTMLSKLRRQKILVDDIVAQMNQHNIPMTRARFEDLFTSRPQRVTIATPATVVAFVNVCFGFDPQVLSAAELIDFADAARLPLSMYDQLALHFSAAVWQEAWYAIVPSAKTPLNRHALVHRTDVFNRLLAALCEERTVIVCGPDGIGKTAIASALAIELEMMTNTRIPFVHLNEPIRSMSAFIGAVAHAANIKPLHNEPIELRMESVIPKNRTTYIGIDNLSDSPSDRSIINAFVLRYPAVRLILTVTLEAEPPPTHFGDTLQGAHVEYLRPLADNTIHSPAMVLCIQTLNALGTQFSNADIDRIHTLCRSAEGNPKAILLRAQQFHAQHAAGGAEQTPLSFDTFTLPQLSILSFLMLFDDPVSQQLLTQVFTGLHADTQHATALTGLVAHAFVEHRYSDHTHSYRATTRAREWYGQHIPAQHVATDTEQYLTRLARMTASRQLNLLSTVSRTDALAVIRCLTLAYPRTPQSVLDVARVISSWLDLWLYHDVSSHVIVLAEEILLTQRVLHPVFAELAVTTARISLSRGQPGHAQRHVASVEPFVSATHYSLIWAKTECIRAQIALQTDAASTPQGLAAVAHHLDQAAQQLPADTQPEWHRYLTQLRIDHAIAGGDLVAAVTICESALAQTAATPITIDYVMLQLQHSLLHLYDGSYDVAAALLSKLANALESAAVPYYQATIQLRLAAIAALQYDLEHADTALRASYACLERVGSLHEVLLAADIYGLILLRRGNTACALAIQARCDAVRADRRIPRIVFLEQLVERVTAHIPAHERAAVTAPAGTTIYDVMDLLRSAQEEVIG